MGYLHTATTSHIGNEAKMFDILFNFWGWVGGVETFSRDCWAEPIFSAIALQYNMLC